jgi:hypothetical protein
MDWTNFYLATAGASATLVGLLFIAVQFNIDTMRDPGNRWRAIARSTFALYTTLFILPLVFLIPSLDVRGRGDAALIIAGFGALRSITTWLPVYRSSLTERRFERAWQTAWLLIGPVLSFLLLASDAYDLAQGDQAPGVLTAIAFVLVGLFVIALRNSWNLLVEVKYEKRQGETPSK